MARFESWLASAWDSVRPRLKIAESIKKAFADDKERIESIVIDNIRLRRQVSELTNIIEDTKRLNEATHAEPPKTRADDPKAEVTGNQTEEQALKSENEQLRGRLHYIKSMLDSVIQPGMVSRNPLSHVLIQCHRVADVGIVTAKPVKAEGHVIAQALTFDDEPTIKGSLRKIG